MNIAFCREEILSRFTRNGCAKGVASTVACRANLRRDFFDLVLQ